MNITLKIICAVLAMTVCFGFASCGSKKAKIRAAITTAEIQVGEEDSKDDDVFENEDTVTVSTKADEVTYVTKHSYEFYDYGNYTYNMIVDYQEYLSKNKYLDDYQSLKEYLDKLYKSSEKSSELQYSVKISKDGSRKYLDSKGKTVTDSKITDFFKSHDRIGGILYYKTGTMVSMNIEFIQPTLVEDFNYTIHMYAIYNANSNASDMKNYSDTREFSELGNHWYYYVQQVDSVRYKIEK